MKLMMSALMEQGLKFNKHRSRIYDTKTLSTINLNPLFIAEFYDIGRIYCTRTHSKDIVKILSLLP